jgi:hypothetical protein
MRFSRSRAAAWLSILLVISSVSVGFAQDPNASIVQGSETGTPLPVTGTVTANQGAAGVFPWLVNINNWLASIGVTQITSPWIVGFGGVAQPVTVGNFPATQPVSGTVTANAGSGTFVVDGSGVTQPVSGTITAKRWHWHLHRRWLGAHAAGFWHRGRKPKRDMDRSAWKCSEHYSVEG